MQNYTSPTDLSLSRVIHSSARLARYFCHVKQRKSARLDYLFMLSSSAYCIADRPADRPARRLLAFTQGDVYQAARSITLTREHEGEGKRGQEAARDKIR